MILNAKGKAKITVNLTTQQAFLYRGGVLIGRTNISSGRKDFETPPGKYEVIQKDLHHVSSQYGDYVTRAGAVLGGATSIATGTRCPAGGHFVGASMPYFCASTGGYGMHAGFVPRFRASHGCDPLAVDDGEAFLRSSRSGHTGGSHRATAYCAAMNLAAELRALLGDEAVAVDQATRLSHSGDKWFASREPDVVVFPRNTEAGEPTAAVCKVRKDTGNRSRCRLWLRRRMRAG